MPPVGPRVADRQRVQRVLIMSGGVSQQAPQLRLPNQVADSENALYSIVDGLSRRAGSWVQNHLQDLDDGTDLLPAGNNRVHRIVRDQSERYLCIHNRTTAASTIRILDLSTNTWATVDQTFYGNAAQTYLNSASPDDFRFRTLLDYTIILNTDVPVTASSKAGVIDQATAASPTVVRTTANHGLTTLAGAITAVSATAPAAVTSAGHGLTTGNLVYISGSDSVPPVDGEWHVRVIDANTFEIPKTVTTAGTTGAWTRGEPVVISGSNTVPSIDGLWHVTVTDATHFTIPVAVTTALTTGAAVAPCTWNYSRPDSSSMPAQLVRRNVAGSGTITGVSAANPAVVTTSAAHGLYTGQTVTIAGTAMVVNQINGARVVRVLSATTFSVPVDTSGGVTTGTGTFTSQAYFQLDTIIWNARPSGDATTNPVPVPWASGTLRLAELREWRERLGLFGGQRIFYGQAGDLFNVWIEDVNAVGDSDPIDRALSSDEVTVIDFAVTAQDSVLINTKAGVQFIFTATGTAGLTPSSVQAVPVTRYRTLPCEPVQMDPFDYYAANNGNCIQLLEYTYDSLEPLKQADDVTQHVPTYIPLTPAIPAELAGATAVASELRRMDASPENGMVFLLRKDKLVAGEIFSRYLWVYRTRYLEQRKVQSAWSRWLVKGVRGVHDFTVIGNFLYLLVHMRDPADAAGEHHFYILRQNVTAESAADTVPTPTT